ncbi:unnamed protein product [Heterosigma akashiwo]
MQLQPGLGRRTDEISDNCDGLQSLLKRRTFLQSMGTAAVSASSICLPGAAVARSTEAKKKCSDIESCREIGDQKVEKEMSENPTVRLPSGIRYKVTQKGLGDDAVADGSKVDLIFSVSEGGGGYMYSRGFGYEKVEFGGKLQSDYGLDSYRIVVGRQDVPIGIEQALLGMKRRERRRIELPPGPELGFETSQWKPEPTTKGGKTRMTNYQRILAGFGSQPAFPAITIWDVEVISTRK